jgi:dihydrofolate synthase/folylpolyglutamate synthase
MDYRAALDYILSFADYERRPRAGVVWDLARIERLLSRLGNPQNAAPAVHIAGTKGKGSTSAMTASILRQAGYRTGLYTSPHLFTQTERIQIDGKPIAGEDFARLTEYLRPAVEAVNREDGLGELTVFEILTALAFAAFRDKRVDYQVLEVGLGGRLDATNVVRPGISVITSISYDHMEVLGDTLAKIAGEKAGIIKPGSLVISAPQTPEAMAVIEKVCRERGVRLIKVGEDVKWERLDFSPEGQRFHLKGLNREYDLQIPLLGGHQLENAASAVTAAVAAGGVLADMRGIKITPEAVAGGLANVRWPGRLQVLGKEPWVVVDCAHNVYSMRKLAEALRQYFKFDRAILVLGVSADKDIKGMVAEAAALTDRVILSRARHPRAAPPARLAEEFLKHGITPQVAESVPAAMKLASQMAAPGDLICATGSVFLVAEVLEGE